MKHKEDCKRDEAVWGYEEEEEEEGTIFSGFVFTFLDDIIAS
jgi:hypothetical protein